MAIPEQLLQLSANTIRCLSIDAIQAAKSGHPGLPMGLADVATVLWLKYLKHDPKNPTWADRDRFVLSGGHGSMLLYSLLHLAGYGLTLDDIRQFRQLGSLTPGHPEYGHTPGVETTTGPLGQGLATAVGMALAERMLAARVNGADDGFQPVRDDYDDRGEAFGYEKDADFASAGGFTFKGDSDDDDLTMAVDSQDYKNQQKRQSRAE